MMTNSNLPGTRYLNEKGGKGTRQQLKSYGNDVKGALAMKKRKYDTATGTRTMTYKKKKRGGVGLWE